MSLRRHFTRTAVAALAVALLIAAPAQGRGFRNVDPIATPGGQPQAENVRRPVDGALVRRAVRTTLAHWNTGDLAQYLAEEFPYRQRLLDALIIDVPISARLRLVSIGAHTTVSQRTEKTPRGPYLVSRVQVRVRMQVVFNSPLTGYQRLPNTSEMVFDIREPI